MSDCKKCNDENNPLRECPTINMSPCVQPKGMGGHPGGFTNIHLRTEGGECKIACGKKITKDTIREFEFYKKLYASKDSPAHIKNLIKFLPKFYTNAECCKGYKKEEKKDVWFGLYTKKIINHYTNNYFIIDNMMTDVGSNPQNLDFKIGYKTAFEFDKGFFGSKRHNLLDRKFSISNKYGFRLEGATDIDNLLKKAKEDTKKSHFKRNLIQQGKKKDQISLYQLEPEFIFDNFFDSVKQAEELFLELKFLWNEFLEPNIYAAAKGEESIGFIGSSILIVKGSKKITFKLIDFGHPLWNSKKTFNDKITFRRHARVVENYTEGLRSFIVCVETWIQINKKIDDMSEIKKPLINLPYTKPSEPVLPLTGTKPSEHVIPKIESKQIESVIPKIESKPIVLPKIESKPIESVLPKIESKPIESVIPKIESKPIESSNTAPLIPGIIEQKKESIVGGKKKTKKRRRRRRRKRRTFKK